MLNGIRMRVKESATAGEIDGDTRFTFYQDGNLVFAEYGGGSIAHGALAGSVSGSRLVFVYAQRNASQRIDMGVSRCEIHSTATGLEITEEFQWLTRSGSGRNVLVQCE